MLSAFAAPGNLPEIHELEALITNAALNPHVCYTEHPRRLCWATSLLWFE